MTYQKKHSCINKLAVVSLLVALSACSHISNVQTNLDQRNFEHYFAPGNVKIFANEAEIPGEYTLVGLVEGEDCQEKAHHAIPDVINARTNARKNAYDIHANAIVFTGCTSTQTQQCHKTTICFGKAYQVISHD